MLLSRRDYCLQAYAVGDTYILNPMNCPTAYEEPPTIMLNTMGRYRRECESKNGGQREWVSE